MTNAFKAVAPTAIARPAASPFAIPRLLAPALLSAVLLWPAQPALAQYSQYGGKLVASTAIGAAGQGRAVAVGEGTAIVGGPIDNSDLGAAWIFNHNNPVAKLVGAGNIGGSGQGQSVALSADGNTAIVGAYFDN